MSRRLQLHALPVFLKSGEYLWVVVDLHHPVNCRGFPGPTRFEYHSDDVLTRVVIRQLTNSVFDRLVLFKQTGVLENLTAVRARVDFTV